MRPMTLLAAALALSVPQPAAAQDVKTDIYLMQIATAVSGSSGGRPVWVVICDDTAGTYDVVGTFPTRSQAQEALVRAGRDGKRCTIEGPYTAGPLYEANALTFGSGGCKKLVDTDCVADSALVFRLDQLTSVTLTYRFRNRDSVVDTIRPNEVEAIFFTMPSIDRLLIPYYVRVRGISWAMRRRQEFLRVFRARDAGVHGP